MPTISVDGKLTTVFAGSLTLWYSYSTLVAFQINGQDKIVSENYWSNTTGKHLNQIGGNSLRYKRPEFDARWKEVEKAMNHLASSQIFGGI